MLLTKNKRRKPAWPVVVKDIYHETVLARMIKKKGKRQQRRRQHRTWPNNRTSTKKYISILSNSKAMPQPKPKWYALLLSKHIMR